MAIVELRLKTWIPQSRVVFFANEEGSVVFHGDGRNESFLSDKYRTHQRFRINTAGNYGVKATKNTGYTIKERLDARGKLIDKDTKKAPRSDLTYKKRVVNGILYLDCVCHSKNPFIPYAPAIDYKFTIKLTRSGHIRITGNHDGFPGYELWRKIGDQKPQLIWSHNPRKTGETMGSLYPPMEHPVNVGKRA
ncbi:DUF3238 domain-containing protein [Bacillus xiapuensis]|uniref:DUF3238 domain-containing protein n=1 Tax=Bacillus xiapuensis TaxID=2014075 RepID=UPI000C230890|nr:DUF3238 domain-containing protein [Bacillus xiapuensis]